ncbi:MAG: hypothetical protein DRN66_01555 [Candidatus Nanohalarchaeota archaeon]|nr:MAG: hypothetical protein DRN66_01555 [Candidatus Nanohaloarchaeota archaeon]
MANDIIQMAASGFAPKPILRGLVRYGAKKLYLFPLPDETSKLTLKNILEHTHDLGIEVNVISKNQYKIGGLIKEMRTIISKEHEGNNKIYINLSGGRKTQSFSLYIASCLEGTKVSKAFYINEEENEFIEVPLIRSSVNTLLSKEKLEILQITNNKKLVTNVMLTKILGKTKPLIHNYLKELESLGYLSSTKRGKEFVYEITEAGKMLL